MTGLLVCFASTITEKCVFWRATTSMLTMTDLISAGLLQFSIIRYVECASMRRVEHVRTIVWRAPWPSMIPPLRDSVSHSLSVGRAVYTTSIFESSYHFLFFCFLFFFFLYFSFRLLFIFCVYNFCFWNA
jgi:hypothetical protein